MRHKKIFLFFILFGCLFLCKPSFAYRPLGTEDAGVAGKEVAQMEISWDYLKWKNDDFGQIFLLVLIYGINERLEVSTELPYLMHNPKGTNPEKGMGDVNIAAKYLLIQEGEKNPAFTAKGAVKLSNGDFDKGLGSGDVDYSLFAVASKTMGSLGVHGQFGYSWVGRMKDKNLQDITLYGVAADYAITEDLHMLGEINGNRHPAIHITEHQRNVLIGITYKVSDRLILDTAYKWGISDVSPEWNTTAGISITF